MRFGESHLAQTYYSQFTNRRQKFGEDEVTLGSDIERLSQLAYPECTHQVREKIACAQFISALYNGFVKRTLQLEGVSSLKIAIQRAMAVRVIQKGNHEKQHYFKNKNYDNEGKKMENENYKKKNVDLNKNKVFLDQKARSTKECWQCGATGHFRADCPAVKQKAGEN